MRCLALVPAVASVFLVSLVSGACGSTRSADASAPASAGRQAAGEGLTLRDPRTGDQKGVAFLEVTIANPGGERVSLRCAPEWYDAKGTVVAAATDWQRLDLKPSEERRLRFSPMPAASRSWRMRFEP